MKDKLLKTNLRIATIILLILEFLISIWIIPNQYDSEFFINEMQKKPIFDFLSLRYQTWTSRLIIEFVLCFVLQQNRLLWVLINTIMMTILGYSILKIFVKEDDKSLMKMAMCFFFLYPLNKVAATCDWGAGTMNYTWPLAMLLFSSISIKKMWNGEKIAKYKYPIYLAALIYACNQEQVCMIACVIYGAFAFLAILRDKKIQPFFALECIIVVLSLLFIITCPGNYMRKAQEIEVHYMEFRSFTLLDKVSLGLTSTVNHLLMSNNIVLLVFSLVSAVYIFKQYKNNLYRTVALIPLVASLTFGALKDIVCRVFPYFGIFAETLRVEQVMLTPENYIYFIHFVPLLLAFVVLGSMALTILLIFKNLKNNVAILIFLVGVMSRVALGFSPTIFASMDRTFLFFEFALLIVCILIWQEFMKQNDKSQVKARNRLATFIAVLAVLQYIQTMIYALMSQM